MDHHHPRVLRRGALVLGSMLVVAACATEDVQRTATTDGDQGEDAPPLAPPTTPQERVLDIMDAKLAYTQAVFQGVVLADYRQVENNARELAALSLEARWMVNDSLAYSMLSDRFRAIAEQLQRDAAAEDLAAMTNGYTALSSSCVDCHRHLQAERTSADMPGTLSWRAPARP